MTEGLLGVSLSGKPGEKMSSYLMWRHKCSSYLTSLSVITDVLISTRKDINHTDVVTPLQRPEFVEQALEHSV